MNLIFFVIAAFIFSLLIGWVGVPSIVIIAKTKRLFDTPSLRKVHTRAIPRLGGVSFFPAMMIAFCFTLGLIYYMGIEISYITGGRFLWELMFFLSGLFLIYMIGLADDIVGVNYQAKFVVQILSASMITMTGLYIHNYEGLIGITSLGAIPSSIITTLAIVFVVNAFNLIDGVDGLCSGIGLIALAVLGGWFVSVNEYIYGMLAFALAGVLLSFFYYNVMGRRLKIFMGDTGSLTVGFVISFLALKFLNTTNTMALLDEQTIASPLGFIIGLLFVPLFDTTRLFIVRILNGRSPFSADRGHIHHKLLSLGMTHIECTMTILASTLGILLLNLAMSELWSYGINAILLIDISIGIIFNIIIKIWRKEDSASASR